MADAAAPLLAARCAGRAYAALEYTISDGKSLAALRGRCSGVRELECSNFWSICRSSTQRDEPVSKDGGRMDVRGSLAASKDGGQM